MRREKFQTPTQPGQKEEPKGAVTPQSRADLTAILLTKQNKWLLLKVDP